MRGNKLDKVRAFIAGFSHDELREVRDYASMRLNLGAEGAEGKARPELSETDMMLEVICDVMRSRGLDMRHPPSLKKVQGFAAFNVKVAELHPFMKRAANTKVKRRAFAHVAINLLVEDLQKMEVAVSSLAVMNHIHRLPSVLDRAFPGYGAAGKLDWVIREE